MVLSVEQAAQFWTRFLELCDKQDEEICDLYSDSASIYEDAPGYRQMVKPGRVYKVISRGILRAANRRGERIMDSSFKNVEFRQEGDNVRITAVRWSRVHEFESPFELLVGCPDGNQPHILEERMVHRPVRPEDLKTINLEIETRDDSN